MTWASSSLSFTKITISDIGSMYRDVSLLTATSLTVCGVQCVESPTCVVFLYDSPTLLCHLLGYDAAGAPLNLTSDHTGEVYSVDTKCSDLGQFIRQFQKCIEINMGEEKNWLEAQDTCETDGGSLMTISSDSEFEYFREMFNSIIVDPQFFSLGAMRSGPADNDFHWVFGSNQIARVSNGYWKQGKPDNANGGEACVASRWEDNFYLNDVTCQHYLGFFICEYLV